MISSHEALIKSENAYGLIHCNINVTSRRFFIHETSEKTIENNILADLSNWIHHRLHRQVTIISPTQRQEKNLGFDDIIEGLPPGITKVLQFKRPYPYDSRRLSNFAKFIIDTSQLQVLLGHFNPGEAYYVFVPLPTTNEVIRNRSSLLRIGMALDIHNVPHAMKTTQRTRVVRVAKSTLTPSLEVADPRKFEPANAKSLKDWTASLDRDFFKNFKDESRKKRGSLKIRNIYFIHISEEHFHFEEFF